MVVDGRKFVSFLYMKQWENLNGKSPLALYKHLQYKHVTPQYQLGIFITICSYTIS